MFQLSIFCCCLLVPHLQFFLVEWFSFKSGSISKTVLISDRCEENENSFWDLSTFTQSKNLQRIIHLALLSIIWCNDLINSVSILYQDFVIVQKNINFAFLPQTLAITYKSVLCGNNFSSTGKWNCLDKFQNIFSGYNKELIKWRLQWVW